MKTDAKVKKKIREQFGENSMVSSPYDSEIAAKCRNGIFVGKRVGILKEYKGIPFAKPPVGKLRWKRPVSPDPDETVYEAFYNGKSPIQTEWPSERASYYPQGEDCLYLNIWTSDSMEKKDKTVMVFFHGGAYGWGGTADPLYDGRNLVTAHPDIVLVTAGYRTGLMGFTDFSSVPGGEDFPDAPNLGILDQIEALRWVAANIESFGGNPREVTIFGESAGGGTVSLLPIIPEAKGLFKRVIAESGSVALTYSKKECRLFTEKLLKESGAGSMDDLMDLSEDELKRINEKLNAFNNFPQRDGRLIPLDPYKPYAEGVTSDIDMMIGTNANEMNYWIGEIGGIIPFVLGIPIKFENDFKMLSKPDKRRVHKFVSYPKWHKLNNIIEFYNEMMFRLPAMEQVRLHSKKGGKAYNYYWTVPSALRFRGACHAIELAYVFGNTDDTIYTGKKADKSISDRVMRMWTNFAKTGDPSDGSVTWTPYSEKNPDTLVIGKEFSVKKNVLKDQERQLKPILKYMINASYMELDYKVPFVFFLGSLGVAVVSGIIAAIIHFTKGKK